LGMSDTSYAWTDEFATNCAIDRAPIEKVFGPDFLRRANCAGSLLTTATDYARFLSAILDGKGLPGRLRDEMLRPQASIAGRALFGSPADTGPAAAAGAAPSWCLGWGAFASRAGAARFHVGYDSPEYENYAALYLDRKIGLVVLTSGGRGPNSAVPHFVEAAIGNNDTPFAWAGYGQHPQSPSSAADQEQPDGLQAWLRSGTLHFSSNWPGGLGQNDIYRVRRVGRRWAAPACRDRMSPVVTARTGCRGGAAW